MPYTFYSINNAKQKQIDLNLSSCKSVGRGLSAECLVDEKENHLVKHFRELKHEKCIAKNLQAEIVNEIYALLKLGRLKGINVYANCNVQVIMEYYKGFKPLKKKKCKTQYAKLLEMLASNNPEISYTGTSLSDQEYYDTTYDDLTQTQKQAAIQAIAEVNNHNIMVCDYNSDNLLFNNDKTKAKLIDFGFAQNHSFFGSKVQPFAMDNNGYLSNENWKNICQTTILNSILNNKLYYLIFTITSLFTEHYLELNSNFLIYAISINSVLLAYQEWLSKLNYSLEYARNKLLQEIQPQYLNWMYAFEAMKTAVMGVSLYFIARNIWSYNIDITSQAYNIISSQSMGSLLDINDVNFISNIDTILASAYMLYITYQYIMPHVMTHLKSATPEIYIISKCEDSVYNINKKYKQNDVQFNVNSNKDTDYGTNINRFNLITYLHLQYYLCVYSNVGTVRKIRTCISENITLPLYNLFIGSDETEAELPAK